MTPNPTTLALVIAEEIKRLAKVYNIGPDDLLADIATALGIRIEFIEDDT